MATRQHNRSRRPAFTVEAGDDFLRYHQNPRLGWAAVAFVVRVVYRGTPAELVARGAATRGMVRPGRKGIPRRDQHGDLFRRQVHSDGTVTIRRFVSDRARARQLPGVADLVDPRLPGELVCRQLVWQLTEEQWGAFEDEAREDRQAERAARWSKR